MKKTLLLLTASFFAAFAFGQTAIDTAAIIGQNGGNNFILLDGKPLSPDFGIRVKNSVVNQALIIEARNQPVMLISLPHNGDHSPVPGSYTIMDGKKLAVKKGSGIAKIDVRPNLVSADNGGSLMVLEYNELFWFVGQDIALVNKDTQETHKLSFKMGLFLEKK